MLGVGGLISLDTKIYPGGVRLGDRLLREEKKHRTEYSWSYFLGGSEGSQKLMFSAGPARCQGA